MVIKNIVSRMCHYDIKKKALGEGDKESFFHVNVKHNNMIFTQSSAQRIYCLLDQESQLGSRYLVSRMV